jgi:hypothetical protein
MPAYVSLLPENVLVVVRAPGWHKTGHYLA